MHLPEGRSFTGTLRKTEWDEHGRPLQDPEWEEVSEQVKRRRLIFEEIYSKE